MPIHLHLRKDSLYVSILADYKGCPFNAHVFFAVIHFLDPHAERFAGSPFGVGQKRKVKRELA